MFFNNFKLGCFKIYLYVSCEYFFLLICVFNVLIVGFFERLSILSWIVVKLVYSFCILFKVLIFLVIIFLVGLLIDGLYGIIFNFLELKVNKSVLWFLCEIVNVVFRLVWFLLIIIVLYFLFIVYKF